ncbi:MAG TPA: TolC family protein [Alteraurantiacibacter sp.]
MKSTICASLLAGAAGLWSAGAAAEPLTIDAAIGRAIAAAPEMAAGQAAADAARAQIDQAGVRPNPTLAIEAENYAGTGGFSVLEQPEVTVTYEQRIERGGKRAARLGYASRGLDLAQAQAQQVRLELAQQVQRAFIDVQIADQMVWIAERRLETEKELQTEALRRVRGYRDPLFVETQVAARVIDAELALEQARARVRAARDLLASFWGGEGATLEVPDGIAKAPAVQPGLAAADAEVREAAIARASAEVVLEQSRARQDYTIGGGVRYMRDTNDVALVAGISIPLGRFDRNQGNIERARAERRRLEAEAEADRLARLRRLAALRSEADAAAERADGLMHKVYPQAVKTLEQVREGYNRGGFRFSDVQDAADAIIAVQQQWAEAMTVYRDGQSEIDRLTGRFDVAAETLP